MQSQSPITSTTGTPVVRIKAAKRIKPVVVTITKPDGLSLRTWHADARGNTVLNNFFDVPGEDYVRGWDAGRRAAAELFAVIKAQPRSGEQKCGLRLCDLLPDVEKAMADCATGNRPSRKGAALGFLSVLDAAIKFTVHNADMQGFVQRELARSQAWRLEDAEREAAKRVAFVARMQGARKAKRTAKAIAAMQKGTDAMDMVPPYAVYANGVMVATHDTEEQAEECYARLRQQRIDAKKVVTA